VTADQNRQFIPEQESDKESALSRVADSSFSRKGMPTVSPTPGSLCNRAYFQHGWTAVAVPGRTVLRIEDCSRTYAPFCS
jgi:hypothetical protein